MFGVGKIPPDPDAKSLICHFLVGARIYLGHSGKHLFEVHISMTDVTFYSCVPVGCVHILSGNVVIFVKVTL